MIEPEIQSEQQRLEWCLRFSNTIDWRKTDHPDESLNSFADLVAWGQRAGSLSNDQAGHLLQEASRNPDQASATLQRAIDLREAIYRVFSATARHEQPHQADLDNLNVTLTRGMSLARLFQTAAGVAWGWADDDAALDRVLWPVARSAAELLTSADLSRVRECEGNGCGWLFLDASKNHTRRWCSMEGCGNRAKASRHYQRKRHMATGRDEHLLQEERTKDTIEQRWRRLPRHYED